MVKLSLEGKKYENLRLIAHTMHPDPLLIHGIITNDYHWTFLVPDSIAETILFFEIETKSDIRSRRIWFQTIVDGDTLTGRFFNFDKNETFTELKGTLDTTIVFYETLVTDIFTTPLPQNRFLRESMQMSHFGFFFDENNPSKTYEEFLTTYANWVSENPNSLYLMTFFALTYHRYESQNDYKKLFNLFSPEMQNSKWGERARRYLQPLNLQGINEMLLQNSWTLEYEKIILDPTKYTLISISASWCGACIASIPFLKEIHEATKDRLDLVYITTDNLTNIPHWNALLSRENIEWRSLWLGEDREDMLRFDWQSRWIPDYILVAPDGYARKIFLREEEDIQKLYSILGM
jgi:thiol-disulfide isomerase/thioredoxin